MVNASAPFVFSGKGFLLLVLHFGATPDRCQGVLREGWDIGIAGTLRIVFSIMAW